MQSCKISTAQGVVEGVIQNGIYKVQGIPYARGPVGEGRLAPPRPPEPWEGVLEGAQPAPICPQSPSDLEKPMGPVQWPQSEDCLTLAVCSPSLEGSLPVAVWLHGGANISGGGNLDWYNGEQLARAGNMVVVNLNFRLGALGFLYHPMVTRENLSILDQIMALKWVRENIRAFGGDPDNVTLFGQSAGANAILHILSLPETEPLFRRVILQSPSIGRANHREGDAARIGAALMEYLGIDPESANARGQLLEKTPEEILEATAQCQERIGPDYQGMLFKPVMERWSTVEQTVEAAAREAGRRGIQVLLGTTLHEMDAFLPVTTGEERARNQQIQLQRYDRPAMAFAGAAVAAGCRVWKYRFDWSAPWSLYSACHCLELPFVFGTLDAWQNAPMLDGASREELQRLTATIQPLWARFVATGSLPEAEWPGFHPQRPLHKLFDNRENSVALMNLAE